MYALVSLIGLLITLACFVVLLRFVHLWLKGVLSGVHIPMILLIAMRIRGTRPRVLVDAKVRAAKAGLAVHLDELETHSLAGGNLASATDAFIRAHHADVNLSWQDICKMQLAGRDLDREIETRMNQSHQGNRKKEN